MLALLNADLVSPPLEDLTGWAARPVAPVKLPGQASRWYWGGQLISQNFKKMLPKRLPF